MRATFDPEREAEELRAYLGDSYDETHLRHYERVLEDEYARIGDEQELYRTSSAYLYNLTAFAMTGTKVPYQREILRELPNGGRLLDYGCGIGSDGLALIECGYEVAFADFDNPSVEYLRWRLRRRGLEATIYDLDAGEPPGGFDLVYAFDVIEHVDDAAGFLAALERQARLVLVNFLDPEPGETCLHRELPVAELLTQTARHRVRSYRVHHDRSHLVLYESKAGSLLDRTRSSAAIALGRARRAAGRRRHAHR